MDSLSAFIPGCGTAWELYLFHLFPVKLSYQKARFGTTSCLEGFNKYPVEIRIQ